MKESFPALLFHKLLLIYLFFILTSSSSLVKKSLDTMCSVRPRCDVRGGSPLLHASAEGPLAAPARL
jgi:hypothetical protein